MLEWLRARSSECEHKPVCKRNSILAKLENNLSIIRVVCYYTENIHRRAYLSLGTKQKTWHINCLWETVKPKRRNGTEIPLVHYEKIGVVFLYLALRLWISGMQIFIIWLTVNISSEIYIWKDWLFVIYILFLTLIFLNISYWIICNLLNYSYE